MKKKIKDLTLEEVKKICEKYQDEKGICEDCPFKWCPMPSKSIVLEDEVEVDE